jgi:hypothetical protein
MYIYIHIYIYIFYHIPIIVGSYLHFASQKTPVVHLRTGVTGAWTDTAPGVPNWDRGHDSCRDWPNLVVSIQKNRLENAWKYIWLVVAANPSEK